MNGDNPARGLTADASRAERVALLGRAISLVYEAARFCDENLHEKAQTKLDEITQTIQEAGVHVQVEASAARERFARSEAVHGEHPQETEEVMPMLPNDNHPGPGCSCRDCLREEGWRQHPDGTVTVADITLGAPPDG